MTQAVHADPRDWLKKLAPHKVANGSRILIELAVTAVPFVVLWWAMWLSLEHATG